MTIALVSLAALAACAVQAESASTTASAAAEPLYVRHAMQAEVNPAIVGIWEVTNNVYTDAGEQDASLITDAQWASLAENAGTLASVGERMAAAPVIHAASAGNMATDEYEVAMADVQRFIDNDRQGFRDMSASFAVLARNLEAAAMAKDGDTALELVGQMDAECSACHAQFWYAEAQ
ncbi:cytochrome c [Alteraurantiacibacter aquimixticola]|nr:cytochrome c [Alteraurantiacibacter aquimixticola]